MDAGAADPARMTGAPAANLPCADHVKEIAWLNLYGGQFRANSPRNDASMEEMSLNGKGAFTSPTVSTLPADEAE